MTAASTAVPLLEARALSFHRQDEPVFAPLDFRLHAGELALVEGDNGSGKTTLLRISTRVNCCGAATCCSATSAPATFCFSVTSLVSRLISALARTCASPLDCMVHATD
jgi:ABC-type hemin transport system ATPase subunit